MLVYYLWIDDKGDYLIIVLIDVFALYRIVVYCFCMGDRGGDPAAVLKFVSLIIWVACVCRDDLMVDYFCIGEKGDLILKDCCSLASALTI